MQSTPTQSHQQPHDIVYRTLFNDDGPVALTDAEVIALLLGRGLCSGEGLRKSRDLLDAHGNCLHRLSKATPAEIMRVRGIGERTAVTLLAAMEFARRKRESCRTERPSIANSRQAHEELRPVLADLPHEEFWMLMLDRGMRLIARKRVSVGGLHGTVADPKCIFKQALDVRACCIVVAHNHPSGQLRPSEEDIRLTKRLCEGGRMLDILVQDHLILTDIGYYSFADNGMLV